MPTNLPQQLTSFVGREREVAEVIRLLASARLLTLTGAGGSGKTRLAYTVAAKLLSHFEDGVFFVSLAPIRDPAFVVSAIAQVLGVREVSNLTLVEAITSFTLEKRILLLLDNFEQVTAAAPLLTEILSTTKQLAMLVTSREALHLYGEVAYRVEPLSIPESQSETAATLSRYDSVSLFVRRAQAARHDFLLTDDIAPIVAEICQRLDGLPLAIELASARINVLPPRALLARLEKRLDLLTHGPRDLPARQQTLRGAIDWSYDLLDDAEKRLFSRLAVFVGGRTLAAVEVVCNASGDLGVDVLEGLSLLIGKGLLLQREASDGEARFFMLETIHEYANEKLKESGEENELRRLHLAYFAALAAEARPYFRGPKQEEWLARLDVEHANIRTALDWARNATGVATGVANEDRGGRYEVAQLGLKLAGALWQFWWVRGYYREGRKQLADVLALSQERTMERGEALFGQAALAARQGDYDVAGTLYRESLEISRHLGDKRAIARSLNRLGIIANTYKDHIGAHLLLQESLDISREVGDASGIASALNPLGVIAWEQGDFPQALLLFRQTLDIYRELGDTWGIALVLDNLGRVSRDQGEHDEALLFHKESLEIKRKLGDKWGITASLAGLARAAWSLGSIKRAAQLWGAEEVLSEAIGTAMTRANLADHERDVAAARTQLSREDWDTAWAEGRALSMEQAIELALSDLPEGEPELALNLAPPMQPYPNDLTNREVEVLRLVVEGLTSAQIASRLFLSRNTVHAHLRSIYNKAGVSTRSAAARFASEHGLV